LLSSAREVAGGVLPACASLRMAAISPCRSTLRVALLRRENDLFNKAADSLERLLLVIFGLKQRGELFDLFAVNLCHIWM
jgi:hypothetical protein